MENALALRIKGRKGIQGAQMFPLTPATASMYKDPSPAPTWILLARLQLLTASPCREAPTQTFLTPLAAVISRTNPILQTPCPHTAWLLQAPQGFAWGTRRYSLRQAGSSFMPSFTPQRQTLPSSAACGRGGSASGKGLKNCLCLQVQLSSIMSPGEGKKYHNEVHQNIHFQGCPSGKKGKYWLEPAADFLGEQFFDRKCQLDHIKISC